MSIWFDATTTLGWERPALGVVRVEAEAARYFLSAGNQCVRFCRFDRGTKRYFEINDEEMGTALMRLDAGGQAGPPLTHHSGLSNAGESSKFPCTLPRGFVQPFDTGDVYISLGLDWDQKDLVFLYELKTRLRLKVILFCYDIIPILMPQYCVDGVPQKFPEYFSNAAWCADKILCISECSRRDLKEFLETVGAPIPALDVVQLGSNILANTGTGTHPSPAVEKICRHRFILFVSTIESRKNHETLYRAYKHLLDRRNKDLPLLVFVGMQGWGVEKLMAALLSDKQTKPYIRILNHISDNDLANLYLNAMFTVFPSLYEGWGLPVAESLAYGKFCLSSSAASIPEVGGTLVEYIDPRDMSKWAERIKWYVDHTDDLTARENKIKNEYKPMTWENCAGSIFKAAGEYLYK